MDLHSIFLFILVCLNILVFILVIGTLYEFGRLDAEQFKYYIIGLAFYGITALFFLCRYILFPPLSNFENLIFAYGANVSPIIGVFYFVKGTEYLAKKENPEFIRNEKLHNLVLYLVVISCVAVIFVSSLWIVEAKKIIEILEVLTGLLYVITILLALILLLEYKNTFSELFAKIIYHYILAVVLLLAGGIVTVQALLPIEFENLTITDLSYFRNFIAIIGGIIVFIPFVICYRSVSKFRKLLEG